MHDLIHTPPLNQIDLIVSCHVLERYKDQYRKQAVSTLHDCLNDDGLLWVMEDGELHLTEQGFSNAALGKFNVFAKSGKPIGDCHDSNAREYTDYSRVHYAPSVKNLLRQHKKLNRHKHYHRVLDLLIDDYMTPGFLLDREGGLVHVIGNIVEYVVPKKHGAYGKDICDMLKSPLDVFLHGSINQVLREKESTSIRIPWQEREGLQTIILNCSVRYFSSGSQTEALLAVLIEKCNKVHSISSEMADSGQVAVVSRLEEDMANLVTLTSQLVSEENAENKRLKQQLESLSYENLQLQEINERLSERYENLIEKKQDAGSVVADVENVKHPA